MDAAGTGEPSLLPVTSATAPAVPANRTAAAAVRSEVRRVSPEPAAGASAGEAAPGTGGRSVGPASAWASGPVAEAPSVTAVPVSVVSVSVVPVAEAPSVTAPSVTAPSVTAPSVTVVPVSVVRALMSRTSVVPASRQPSVSLCAGSGGGVGSLRHPFGARSVRSCAGLGRVPGSLPRQAASDSRIDSGTALKSGSS